MSTRREFIRTGGTLVGTLAFSSTSIVALAPANAWSLELESFNTIQGRVLLRLIRHIFPHDDLDDAVYALVVKDLDAAAVADPETAKLLVKGIANLDAATAGSWAEASPEQQFKIVESIAGNPFFEKVRSTSVVSLYNNELAFAHFGYEGSSFEKGGYLNRGFDDLTWLPSPPEDASPGR